MDKKWLLALGAVVGGLYWKKRQGSQASHGSKGKWLAGDPRSVESLNQSMGFGWATSQDATVKKLRSVEAQGKGTTSGWGIEAALANPPRQMESKTQGASSGWGNISAGLSGTPRTMESATDAAQSGWGRVYGPTKQQLDAGVPQQTIIQQQTIVQQRAPSRQQRMAKSRLFDSSKAQNVPIPFGQTQTGPVTIQTKRKIED